MLGAIAGDIIGSPWEGGQCSNPDFFGYACIFTDDTVCTIAVADALVRRTDLADTLRAWVNRYPNRGYGGSFINWAHSPSKGPYNSFGNGGAMRVSPAALLARSLQEAVDLAEFTASVTHNHPEGLRGARAIARAIWLARQGHSVRAIADHIERTEGYDLSESVDDMATDGGGSTLAAESVPHALVSALDASIYDDVMLNALRIGGDTDTIACMAGGIGEALFGLPPWVVQGTRERLPAEMLEVLDRLYAAAGQNGPRLAPSRPVDMGVRGEQFAAPRGLRVPKWLSRMLRT